MKTLAMEFLQKNFKDVSPIFLCLLVIHLGTIGVLGDECKEGIVVNNSVYHPYKCCRITCPVGHEAQWCTPGNITSSWCSLCTGDKYNENISVLGNNDKCHYKQRCSDKYKIILDDGSPTRDRVCGCEPGHTLNPRNNICYTDGEDNINKVPMNRTENLIHTKSVKISSGANRLYANNIFNNLLFLVSLVLLCICNML